MRKSMKVILHIAAEYPCVNRPINTVAVKNFIDKVHGVENKVVVITRTPNPMKINIIEEDNGLIAVRYWGLPMGIFHYFSMLLLYYRVKRLLDNRRIKFDIIHSHKLCYEGILGYMLSSHYKVRHFVSVRGESDKKIINYKPLYRPLIKKVIDSAEHIFFVSAWYKAELNKKFSIDNEKQSLLPNFVNKKAIRELSTESNQKYVTIFDMNVYKKKGFHILLAALEILKSDYGHDLKLDVIGRCSPSNLKLINDLIVKHSLSSNVTLLGEFSNEELLGMLSFYEAMLLPSRNETFGMVYVESLLCGVPILHSNNTGIDGFIDSVPSRVSVDPFSIDSVVFGILTIMEKSKLFKEWLNLNNSKLMNDFSPEFHCSRYLELINMSK